MKSIAQVPGPRGAMHASGWSLRLRTSGGQPTGGQAAGGGGWVFTGFSGVIWGLGFIGLIWAFCKVHGVYWVYEVYAVIVCIGV